MTKKCVLFLRVSTAKQDYNQQIEKLKEYASAYGYTNENDFLIIGGKESGRKLGEEERETISTLKRTIEDCDVDLVIIYEISRLARRMDVLISVRDTLLERHIQLVCYTPHFQLLTDDRQKLDPSASLVFSIFGTTAETEANILRERVLKAFQYKSANGQVFGGSRPFGYEWDENKRLVVKEEEAEIVRDIFDSYENGMSQLKIARELKMKYPDRNFLLSFVSKTLNNELYTGKKREAGSTAKNQKGEVYRTYNYSRQYPPIITEEQFKRCREIASANKNKRTPSKHIYFAYKLLKCPECGGYWGGGSQRNSYHCANAYNDSIRDVSNFGRVHCKYKHSISINLLDSLLWHTASVSEAKFIIEDSAKIKKDYEKRLEEVQEELNFTLQKLQGIDAKKERVAETFTDGAISKEKYKERIAKVEDERKSLLTKEVELKSAIEQLEERIQKIQERSLNFKGGKKTYSITEVGELTADIREKIIDDQLRYEVIHKHIMEVSVFYSTEQVNLKNTGKPVEVKVERISVKLFQGKEINYYFVPHYNKLYYENPSENPNALLEDFDFLKRFGDIRREKAKKKREKERESFKAQFDGFYTPTQIVEKYGVNKSVGAHLHDRYGVPVTHFGKFCAYKIEDVEKFMAGFIPKGKLSTGEVEKILGLSEEQVRRAVDAGELKAVKYKTKYYFTAEDVEEHKKTH